MGKEAIHSEFLQEEVTVENLYNDYQNFNRDNFIDNSKLLRKYLKNGSSSTVAKVIES